MQSTNREAQKPRRQETSATELNGHPLKLDHRPHTCTSTRRTMSGRDVTMSNVQRNPICSCPQLNLGHVRSRVMKSAIMVSSSSSPRHMNNAPGESGSCAASPNDVHHRCRWQGNGQILVLHGELQQELAQFPEAGRTSCFISGLVLHARRCMGPIGPLRTERRQPIGTH